MNPLLTMSSDCHAGLPPERYRDHRATAQHTAGSWPTAQTQLLDSLHGIPETEIAAMLGGNTMRFCSLDAEKLAPIVARIGPKKKWLE
ncbi:MAG: hypothetical protein CMJ98_13865 [Planctomycetes bacterium]|nr:hypothetical protein [Planctomycetota bacterium]MBT38490.1 hypothetical protein [Deltaproteobacteria bacterium]MCP4243832.1 hypothetical protein [bacterium]MDP6075559.1 hypothetical protein [Myxococcota bacterium]MDP6244756.1 hypothetical protein [Myxococcota bacterium]